MSVVHVLVLMLIIWLAVQYSVTRWLLMILALALGIFLVATAYDSHQIDWSALMYGPPAAGR